MASAGTTPGVVSAKGGHVNHHQSTAREKDGAKGPPGRGGAAWGVGGSAGITGSGAERQQP